METQITAMPEMDWLTGLSSRAAFGRQVNQADRDRDRFAVALIEIEDFGDINRQLDYETGDELLRTIGQTLAYQTSVNTYAARVGGAQFAVLTLEPPSDDLGLWVDPIVTAVKEAIAGWTFDQIDYTGECFVEPDVRVGAANGSSSRVWPQASTALELAKAGPVAGATVLHDPDDPRIRSRQEQEALAERLTATMARGELDLAGSPVAPLAPRGSDRTWLRLGIVQPVGLATVETVDLADMTLVAPIVGRHLEQWLVEAAAQLLNQRGTDMQVTVPIARELRSGRSFARRLRSTLERLGLSGDRLLFEVDEGAAVSAGTIGREFISELDRIGCGIVLAGSQGGWRAWRATQDMPIDCVKPDAELVGRAGSGEDTAGRILGTVVDQAAAAGRPLIAPSGPTPRRRLIELGFDHAESADAEVQLRPY